MGECPSPFLLTQQTGNPSHEMSELTYTLYDCHALGLTIGLVTFMIIGLFHPIVIKCEYYFGIKCRWIFMAVGFLSLIFSVLLNDILWSCILGVIGFSSFWSIREIIEQEERVRKGWFPRNPNRVYPWEIKEETEALPSAPDLQPTVNEPEQPSKQTESPTIQQQANPDKTKPQKKHKKSHRSK